MRKIKNRKAADVQLAISREWQDRGLCGNCGAPPEPNEFTCEACLKEMRKARVVIAAQKRDAGLCVQTGCDRFSFGHAYCSECSVTREIGRKARRGDSDAVEAYRKILEGRLAQRVALGYRSDDRRTRNALVRLAAAGAS
jgi:hypothetical protein